MQAYETTAKVQTDGRLAIAGLPFPDGTEVDVMITPKRASAAAFTERWRELVSRLRDTASPLPEESEIQAEIDAFRARQ
jgi:hypothetical protein